MLRPTDYLHKPDAFFSDILHIERFDKLDELLWSVHDNQNTCAKGCYTSSKTFTAAGLVHWWMLTMPDSICVTTAPTENQVANILWRDIRSIASNCRPPLYDNPILTTKIDAGEKWYAVGFTANESNVEAFQGFHSRRTLYIIDEGNGVNKTFFDARHKIAHNPDDRFLVIGNPRGPESEFYRCFQSSAFNQITISAFDTPNVQQDRIVIPGLITLDTVNKWREEWGEESMEWKTRVLAEFWEDSSAGLIPMSWIDQSFARYVQRFGRNSEGFDEFESGIDSRYKLHATDVSTEGRDETICGRRVANVISRMEPFHDSSTTAIAHHVEVQYNRGYKGIVDAIGVGSGVVSTARDDGYACRAYKGSEATEMRDKTGQNTFANTRSYAYWLIREALDPRNSEPLDMCPDPKLKEDLVGLSYREVAHGKIQIETKADVVKRLGRSPDRGDTLAMLCYGYPRFVIPEPVVDVSPNDYGRIKKANKDNFAENNPLLRFYVSNN